MQTEIYDQVTASIIAKLESGIVPWVKPWDGGGKVSKAIWQAFDAAKALNPEQRLISSIKAKDTE